MSVISPFLVWADGGTIDQFGEGGRREGAIDQFGEGGRVRS